jgi:hypothetical protein
VTTVADADDDDAERRARAARQRVPFLLAITVLYKPTYHNPHRSHDHVCFTATLPCARIVFVRACEISNDATPATPATAAMSVTVFARLSARHVTIGLL